MLSFGAINEMKILLLLDQDSEANYTEFYTGLHKQIGSVDYRRLGNEEQQNLKGYFNNHVDLSKYDRIIFDLPFLVIAPQVRFFQQLKHIVFFDDTAGFDEMVVSQHYNQHLNFYKKILWARVIVTSYQAMHRLQTVGIDAWCVPEGYNTLRDSESHQQKDIEMMLLDNQFSETADERRSLINSLKAAYPKLVVEEDLTVNFSRLGRAKIAVCADIGVGGYSGKVFSAMACGCLVMCYNQGRDESLHMGLVDMQNIVLFNSFENFCEQIDYLEKNSILISKIAQAGRDFATENHQQVNLGRQAAKYILTSMRDLSDYRKGFSAFGHYFSFPVFRRR